MTCHSGGAQLRPEVVVCPQCGQRAPASAAAASAPAAETAPSVGRAAPDRPDLVDACAPRRLDPSS